MIKTIDEAIGIIKPISDECELCNKYHSCKRCRKINECSQLSSPPIDLLDDLEKLKKAEVIIDGK